MTFVGLFSLLLTDTFTNVVASMRSDQNGLFMSEQMLLMKKQDFRHADCVSLLDLSQFVSFNLVWFICSLLGWMAVNLVAVVIVTIIVVTVKFSRSTQTKYRLDYV